MAIKKASSAKAWEERPPGLKKEFLEIVMASEDKDEPVELRKFGEFWKYPGDWKKAWYYKGGIYVADVPYTDEEKKLLIMDEYDKERRKFERLKKKFDTPESKELSRSRPRIPEQVRIEVWRRDGGKCAGCGSRERLEYDHIVPVSKGGSTTTRNIELLCENCNRDKGAEIG